SASKASASSCALVSEALASLADWLAAVLERSALAEWVAAESRIPSALTAAFSALLCAASEPVRAVSERLASVVDFVSEALAFVSEDLAFVSEVLAQLYALPRSYPKRPRS